MEDSFPLRERVLVWQTLLHVVPCLPACMVIEMMMYWSEIDSNICRDVHVFVSAALENIVHFCIHFCMYTQNSVINAFYMIECTCMYCSTCTCRHIHVHVHVCMWYLHCRPIKLRLKEMVHWNVENGQITPLQIAENINKMSKVLLKPSLLWGIN